MKKNMKEFLVQGIALDEKKQQPIILLKQDKGEQILPLPIGPFEASAIIIEMEDVYPPQPLTHDLFARFFSDHGFSMRYLEIYGVLEDKFLSRIAYQRGFKQYFMEVRPSDGIALAIRLNATIYICEEVFHTNLYDTFNWDQLTDISSEILFLGSEKTRTNLM